MEPLKIKSQLGERLIGDGQPVFIVAEMSGNHHQSLAEAKEIIAAAALAGADAIKIQTYTADTITLDCDRSWFQIKTNPAWAGQTLYQLYQKACTPWTWQAELKACAESHGLWLFSTPFDATAVDFLEDLSVPIYKIASFEIVDIPLLAKIGQTKKPVIISRGMASLMDIELALKTLRQYGTPSVAILQCVSAYPAQAEEMNLATIPDLRARFDIVPGLSDHSLDERVALIALSLGAKIIEKHFTLSRAAGGPDAAFSLEPAEFKKMAASLRLAEKAIGRPSYELSRGEEENIIFRKSLFAAQFIKKGEKLTAENVRSVRPGYGLPPKHYEEILGRTAKVDIERGVPLSFELID